MGGSRARRAGFPHELSPCFCFISLPEKGCHPGESWITTGCTEVFSERFEVFVSFSLFIFYPQQIGQAGKALSQCHLVRPVLKTHSPAGTRNNLLVPGVLQCPWGFQDITGLSPIFYVNNFHTFLIRTQTPMNSLKDLAKTFPGTPPFPPPDPQPLPISPWAAGENWFSGGM